MRRKSLILLCLVVVLGCLYLVIRRELSLNQLAAREHQLRTWIRLYPWRSMGIGLALNYVTSLVPGTAGKSIVFGWFFGFPRAVIIVVVAMTAAAMTAFGVSRLVFRDLVQSRHAGFLLRLNRLLQQEGAFYLVALRMLHAPYTAMNYVAGACNVGPWTFCWTTALGLLPGTAVFVYLGTQLPTLRDLVQHGVSGLLSPSLFAALVLLAIVPWLTRWWVQKVRNKLRRNDAATKTPAA